MVDPLANIENSDLCLLQPQQTGKQRFRANAELTSASVSRAMGIGGWVSCFPDGRGMQT